MLLLTVRPAPLAAGSAAEGFLGIQQHPWFKGFDWQSLIRKDMQPPHCPLPPSKPFAEEELEPQVRGRGVVSS